VEQGGGGRDPRLRQGGDGEARAAGGCQAGGGAHRPQRGGEGGRQAGREPRSFDRSRSTDYPDRVDSHLSPAFHFRAIGDCICCRALGSSEAKRQRQKAKREEAAASAAAAAEDGYELAEEGSLDPKSDTDAAPEPCEDGAESNPNPGSSVVGEEEAKSELGEGKAEEKDDGKLVDASMFESDL
jgi:hypothetical protein